MIDIVLLALLVVVALVTLFLRDALAAVISFSVWSLIMAILWQRLRAPDLALTEAAVGAGVTTVFFVVAIFKTARKK